MSTLANATTGTIEHSTGADLFTVLLIACAFLTVLAVLERGADA